MSIEPSSPGPGTPGQVHVGAAVISRDGNNFANVKTVRGGYFELDVPRAHDFWLSSAYVATSADGHVTLNLSRDEVNEHRLNAAGIELPDTHGEVGDRVIGDDEALAQRERMERELQEQRSRMGRPPETESNGTAPALPEANDGGLSAEGLQEVETARDVDTVRGEMERQRDEATGLRFV
jgi:hypothetical protein